MLLVGSIVIELSIFTLIAIHFSPLADGQESIIVINLTNYT